MSKHEGQRYAAPPMLNGNTYTVKQPIGERAKAVANTVTEIPLTGDLFLAMPDSGGNASKTDFIGEVVLELQADGDDIAWVVGPAGGGASGPTFNGSTGAPGFAAATNAAAAILYNKNPTPYRYTFSAGANDHRHDSIYAIARTTSAVLHYRIISSLPGAR